MEDEREAGRRAVLNAGHTVAHAVEHASGFARVRTATPSRWASWPRRTWPSRSASP